jgi:B12-binding domain/radical SAM domain protein
MNKLAVIFYYRDANKYSLVALAGALESKPALQAIDLFFENKATSLLSKLCNVLNDYDIVVVAISVYSSQFKETKRIIQEIKNLARTNQRENTSLLILGGGPHATGDPKGTLDLGFDAIAIGEGEETFRELLLLLQQGSANFNSLEGLAYRDKGGLIQINPKRDYVDLDKYQPFHIKHHKFGPIEITRGCPFGCTYCQTPRIFGHNVRHRSLEHVLYCVEVMKLRHFRDIRFTTPNFFSWQACSPREVNINALTSMFTGIRQIMPKARLFIGSFPSEVRPENVTSDTIALVKEFGANDNLVIGAQTGSERMLKQIHRGHTVDEVYSAVDLTINAGFKAYVDIIFGLPGENTEDELQTIEMTEKLIKMGARIHAHTFMPLVQTPLSNEPPGKISPLYLKLLNKWVPSGSIYGQWQKQGRFEFFTENKIKSY